MPGGFGARSGRCLGSPPPPACPGSAAPRSPLARSQPPKCRFCSSLSFKGVWVSGGKCWSRDPGMNDHAWNSGDGRERPGRPAGSDALADPREPQWQPQPQVPPRSQQLITQVPWQGESGSSHCPVPLPAGDRDGSRHPKARGCWLGAAHPPGLPRMSEGDEEVLQQLLTLQQRETSRSLSPARRN